MEGNNLNLSNVKILEHYGVIYPPEGPGWKSLKCPFHDDTNASASSNGSGFACFACGIRGGPVQLLMEREGIDYYDGLELYKEITGDECILLSKAASGKRRRPFDNQLSESPRAYERHGGLFSLRSGKGSTPRIRARFSDGKA